MTWELSKKFRVLKQIIITARAINMSQRNKMPEMAWSRRLPDHLGTNLERHTANGKKYSVSVSPFVL